MSGDEIVVCFISGGLTLVFGVAWLLAAVWPPALVCPRGDRWPMWLTPLVCGAVLLFVLMKLAADDVTSDPKYIVMYLLLGIAWVGLAQRFCSGFGLYMRQDVIERRNAAAGIVLFGLLLGLTLCYAGGNIGNGPGWWVVVFSAALSTAALLALWMMLDAFTGLTDRVTINRDVASGIRLGAVLAAWGLILGRAVAGDWVSAEATVRDFAGMGWPVLVVAVAEIVVSQSARLSASRPAGPPVAAGVVPALVYLCGAELYVASLGKLP